MMGTPDTTSVSTTSASDVLITGRVPFYCTPDSNKTEVTKCIQNVLFSLNEDSPEIEVEEMDEEGDVVEHILINLLPYKTTVCYFDWQSNCHDNLTVVFDGTNKTFFIKDFMRCNGAHAIYVCEKLNRCYIIRGFSNNHFFAVDVSHK